MIRLYNHTRYPDATLRDVFTFAARCAGVKGDVPVKLTHSTYARPRGFAHWSYPYRKTLIGKPTTSRDKRVLRCPVGWVEMSLPRMDPKYLNDANTITAAAEWFVDVAIHEMAHIRQFRTEQWSHDFAGKRERGRRIAHSKRPCEIDAENAVYDVHHDAARNRRRLELVESIKMVLDHSAAFQRS